MENSKLDRLFREKAEHYEVQPSKDAWNTIAGQTSSANNYNWVWKVAASVILLIAVSLIFWKRSMEAPLEFVAMDYPEVPVDKFEIHDFVLPSESMALDHSTTTQQDVAPAVPAQQVALEEPEVIEQSLEIIPTLTLSPKREVLAIEQSTPDLMSATAGLREPMIEEIVEPEAAVTIRYYADNTTVDADSTQGKKRFGSFLARAQGFQPGELLADLRAAKDDLFRSKKLN